MDEERLGSLDEFDAVRLLERLSARRAAARPGVDAAIFELEVDTAPRAHHLQTAFGLAAHTGYERAQWVTSDSDLTLCASGCAREAKKAKRKLRTLVVLTNEGVTLWSGREVADGPPPARADVVKRAEALWTASPAELEASLTRACEESHACSHMLIYLSDLDGARLGHAFELLDRVGRAASASGSAAPVLELRLDVPPNPSEEAGAFVAERVSDSGRMPPVLIRQIVRASYGLFRHCYEQGLGRNPNLQGRVTVRFVIGRDGAVSDASNGGTDLPDEAVVRCVIDVFRTIRFPAPDGGIVTVQYPIMLQPG